MTLDPALLPWADKAIILMLASFMFILALTRGQRAPAFPVPPIPSPSPVPVPVPVPQPIPVPVPEPSKPIPGPAANPQPAPAPGPVHDPAPAPVPPAAGPVPIFRNTHITATSWAGTGDDNNSSYTGKNIDGNHTIGYSLPARIEARPPARIRSPKTGRVVSNVPLLDVGPWNGITAAKSDPYWATGSRPQAETGTDLSGRHTNLAGIDITPACWAALGYTGNLSEIKDVVDWDFESHFTGPVALGVPVSPIGPAQPTSPVSGYTIPTGDNHLKVLTDQQCRDLFGQFDYTNGSGGDIIQEPSWVAAHIVDAPIPQLAKFKIKSVKCHKLVAPWLIKAFAEIEAAGLLGTILSYDGLWVPRHINHNPSQGISRHSYGAAMDINANWNAYGTLGAKRGTIGSTWEIEPIFAANGFACGRWFGWPHLPAGDTDGMHFEWVGPPQ